MSLQTLILNSLQIAIIAVAGAGLASFPGAALADKPQTAPATGMILPQPKSADDTGFESLFDGKTLRGWQGDPTYWRVESGSLVGEITPATVLQKNNSFIVWRGGSVQDFELKLQYRITRDGNSGINYRSEELSEPKWTMRGYQCDIDGSDWGKPFAAFLRKAGIEVPAGSGTTAVGESLRVTGQTYEERGRQILALPGQFTRVPAAGIQRVIGFIGEKQVEELATDDWNELHIVARGNVLIHMLNGYVISQVIDEDPDNRRMEGKLGMQVHVGPPMKVEFRNIRLKQLH